MALSIQEAIAQAKGSGGGTPPPAPAKLSLQDAITAAKNAPSPTPPSTPAAAKPGAMQKFGSFVGNMFKGYTGTLNDIADKTGEQFKQAGENIVKNTTAGADTMAKGDPVSVVRGAVQSGLGATGGFAQGLFAPVTAAISEMSDKASDIPAVQKFAQHPIVSALLDKTGKGTAALDAWATKHPEASADLSNAFQTLMTVAGGDVKLDAGPTVGDVAGGVKDTVVDTAKAVPRLMDRRSLDETVGQITQGNKAQIAKAADALKVVDTSGVKTYADLKTAADETIKDFAKAQDTHLSQYKKPYPLSTFDKTVSLYDKAAPGGVKTVTDNFVQTAFDHLKEVYTNLHDTESLASLSALEKKANARGLTAQEINSLARQYGSEMGSKAFNKDGTPSSSISQRSYENVRSGLKDISRDLLPTKLSQSLDENMSNLYTLRDTAQRMEDAVQKLSNKVQKRGIMEKIGRAVGHTIDLATGKALSGLLNSFVKSNIGLKSMNSLDLQGALEGNLARVNKLIDSGSDAEITSFVKDILAGKMRSIIPLDAPLQLPAGSSKGSSVEVPMNMPSESESTVDARSQATAEAGKSMSDLRNNLSTPSIEQKSRAPIQAPAAKPPQPKTLGEVFKKGQTIIKKIPNDMQPIVKFAQKYKNATQFKNALGNVIKKFVAGGTMMPDEQAVIEALMKSDKYAGMFKSADEFHATAVPNTMSTAMVTPMETLPTPEIVPKVNQ